VLAIVTIVNDCESAGRTAGIQPKDWERHQDNGDLRADHLASASDCEPELNSGYWQSCSSFCMCPSNSLSFILWLADDHKTKHNCLKRDDDGNGIVRWRREGGKPREIGIGCLNRCVCVCVCVCVYSAVPESSMTLYYL
jgi:hypothetical protein